MDVALRHPEHPLHGRLPAEAARDRRAEAAVAAADGHRRAAGGALDVRARGRVRRAGDPVPGGPRRRRLRRQRPEDVGHERPPRRARGAAVQDRPAGRPAVQGHVAAHRREGARGATFEGITVPPNIEKMGYHGVETTELVFEDHRVPGGEPARRRGGQGFIQIMDAIEVGRVNVAARAVGLATRAFEEAIAVRAGAAGVRQADRPAPDDPGKLAEMGTKLEAARLMLLQAAKKNRRRAGGPRGRDGEALLHARRATRS